MVIAIAMAGSEWSWTTRAEAGELRRSRKERGPSEDGHVAAFPTVCSLASATEKSNRFLYSSINYASYYSYGGWEDTIKYTWEPPAGPPKVHSWLGEKNKRRIEGSFDESWDPLQDFWVLYEHKYNHRLMFWGSSPRSHPSSYVYTPFPSTSSPGVGERRKERRREMIIPVRCFTCGKVSSFSPSRSCCCCLFLWLLWRFASVARSI